MKFIKIGNRIINPAQIAWATKTEGGVRVHFAVPFESADSGPFGGMARQHGCCTEHFQAEEGETIWKALSGLADG